MRAVVNQNEITFSKSSSNSVTCSEGSSLPQGSDTEQQQQDDLQRKQQQEDNGGNMTNGQIQEVSQDMESISIPLSDTSDIDTESLGGTTNTSSGGLDGANAKPTELKSLLVPLLRFLGYWALVAGTIFVGIKTKQLASESKEQQLEDQFLDLAAALIQNAQDRHRANLDALKTMSLTAMAMSRGQSWPFVTLPDFDLWTNRFSIDAKDVTLVVLAQDHQRQQWTEYSQSHWDLWVPNGDAADSAATSSSWNATVPYVWRCKDADATNSLPDALLTTTTADIVADEWKGVAAISWQSTTPVLLQAVNFNQFSISSLRRAVTLMNATREPMQWSDIGRPAWTYLLQPIRPTDTAMEVVGYLMAQVDWLSYFKNEFIFDAKSTPGVVIVVNDLCLGQAMELDLYLERGPRLLEPTELAILAATSTVMTEAPLARSTKDQVEVCSSPINIQVYATDVFTGIDGIIHTDPPKLAMATGLFVVLLGTICFLAYDFVVRRQQAKLAQSAKKSLAIVNSLFPANVRDRLLEKAEPKTFPTTKSINLKRSSTGGGGRKKTSPHGNKFQNRITTVFQSMAESIALGTDSVSDDMDLEDHRSGGRHTLSNTLRRRMASKPIADLFPEVTVLFADIAGFTAWSSVREPSQVFTLLESIFETFDAIAKKHKVFKVETIGDCYVAATGLPDACANHAIVMCQFARKALHRMGSVVRALETFLGPNTSELSMRIGLHSGPIMAGVLRGEKTRFQLFGDTMNTAARIEATGEKDRIHLSQQTATHLINAGKGEWVKERDALVTAKGKGELQTYWLTLSENSSDTGDVSERRAPASDDKKYATLPSSLPPHASLRRSMNALDNEAESPRILTSLVKCDQLSRLVDFNAQVLENFLQKMVAMRQEQALYIPSRSQDEQTLKLVPSVAADSVFDEVQESISLPTEPAKYLQNPDRVTLSPLVKSQLRAYVATIASMYRDVPFHCFDHASHVVMSVTKLLARVVTPETIDYRDMRYKIKAGSSALHEYTYGITSDPLTQFAVAFAALIHDVDHTGVPNAQLVKEGDEIAKIYNDKSVAEQHSINLAWDLLMESNFKELRGCIYTSQAELDRFRALVVNAVMATDIADKSLLELRRRRWDKAFGLDDPTVTSSCQESTNRKATIVIEHLIQASDVSHTMQHWHVFLRWNKRLFRENYMAYLGGRSEKDPLESWYQGELGFFDFYIIPLAKKLKECGVFGVASDEYLNYAVANRTEWEQKGHAVVEEYRLECASMGQNSAISTTATADCTEA